MRRSKKIIIALCVTLVFSVTFMVCASAYEAAGETFYLHDNILPFDSYWGSVTQYSSDGSYHTVDIIAYSGALTFAIDYISDDYGVYGFNWRGFDQFPSGFTSNGDCYLSVPLNWTGFVTSSDLYYELLDCTVKFRCFIGYYTDTLGNYKYYTPDNLSASVNVDGNSVSEIDFDYEKPNYGNSDTYFTFNIKGPITIEQFSSLSIDLSWTGKPSNNNNPFIHFEFIRDGSYLRALEVGNYYNDIQNQINSDINNIKNGLDFEKPDVDSISANLSPDITKDAVYFRGSGEFHNFISSLAVVGVSIGSIGYILHGKKE